MSLHFTQIKWSKDAMYPNKEANIIPAYAVESRSLFLVTAYHTDELD